MRIAQVSPLYESVPPRFYGGTERVVSWLTEELINQGHDVTLFASADSVTKARLVSPCNQALRLSKCNDPIAPHILSLQHVASLVNEFDIIHFHLDYLHLPLFRKIKVPKITTLHSRMDLPEYAALFAEFSDMSLVSISNSQRQPLSFANWAATVYHGLPRRKLEFKNGQGDYLAFLGRISPEKRPDRAIEISIRSDIPIKIAAKIDPANIDYYEHRIKPLLSHPLVEFVGEIGDAEKNSFLGNARALLFPIDWPEPFGLVMIESLACGTPVIAFENGSVPEIIENGKTGFVVACVDDAITAAQKVQTLDRSVCRQQFEERFSVERMTKDYVGVYERIIREHESSSKIAEIKWTDLRSRELSVS